MALIGEIAVNIVARTGQFTKGMNAVRKNLNTVGNALGRFGGVVAGGLLAAAKSFSTFGDDIAKMAKRIGFSVESLSALEFAAAQSGAGLSDIEAAMRGLSKRILDVTTGTADALARLGVNVQQLQSQSPEQQFMTLSHAIAAVQDPTEKAGLAMAVFGRSATKLIPLLNEGETGMAALIAEAQELGIVLTAQDAAAAEQLNDAFGRLGFQFKAIVKEFAVAVSGPLLQFLDRAKEIGKATIDWIRQNQALIVWIGKIGAVSAAAGATLLALSGTIGVVIKIIAAFKASLLALNAVMLLLSANPFVLLSTAIVAVTAAALDSYGAFDGLKRRFADMTGLSNALAGAIANVVKSIEQLPADKYLPDTIKGLEEQIGFTEGRISDIRRELVKMHAETALKKSNPRIQDAMRFLKLQEDLLAKQSDKLRGIKAAEDAARTAEEQRRRGAAFGKRILDPIRDALHGGLKSALGDRVNQGVLGKIGSVLNALEQLPTKQAEEMQEVVRGQNDIIKKGSQEAITFAARQRQQASSPDKKIEKNTKDTVTAVNGVKTAINDLAKTFGREPVFSIPAS